MDMQDKEFDDLFRSKLDDFEAEPSGGVWGSIDEELSSKKRRAIFIPILRIAASVILVVGLGILFFVNKKVLPVKGGKGGIVKNTVQPVKKPDVIAPEKQPEPMKTVVQQRAVNSIAHVVINKKRPEQVKPAQKNVVIDVPAPELLQRVESKQLIAAVQPSKMVGIAQPVVPGPETPLVVKSTADIISQTKAVAQVSAQIPATDAVAKPKRRGIHNFGDLVNIVVAKVDKRKDKAIEFTDSDDDESTVTAVNIGPVKIKRELGK